jgi:hypothetical protein
VSKGRPKPGHSGSEPTRQASSDSTPASGGPEGFVPLTREEAQALMTEALAGIDRDTLLAERAEAEAQLRAAEATLGVTPAPANGRGPTPLTRESGGEETDTSSQNPHGMEAEPTGEPALDVAELRRAAARARAADDVLARAASEAAERPRPAEAVTGAGGEALGGAEDAFARALELRDDVPAAWRRLVGAMISATGMAIVITALGWNVYWLLIPISLIAIMTVDLRVAGKAAREASAEVAAELAAVGDTGPAGLDAIRRQRARMDEAERRLAEARADRDAAYAAFAALAPGRLPSEVDDVIADYEAERAARAAAEADAQAEVRSAAEAAAAAASPAPAVAGADEPALEPAAASPAPEALPSAAWWFGSQPGTPRAPEPEPVSDEPAPVASTPTATPAAAATTAPVASPPAPVRALAERLSKEGREALARIEAQLAALDRVDLAKKSLEWHEAQANGQPNGRPSTD